MPKLSATVKLVIFFLVCAALFLFLGYILTSIEGQWSSVSYTASILCIAATVFTVIIGFFRWLFLNKSNDEQNGKEQ